MKYVLSFFLLTILSVPFATGQSNPFAAYNVTWGSLGTDENSSMPLGNGDIAVNAWTEKDGDIVLLIAKADAWSENCQLLKLGRVRISLSPNPFINSKEFTQTLEPGTGEVELKAGKNLVHIWVDANHPVIRIVSQTENPVTLTAASEVWRTEKYHLDEAQVNRIQLGHWEWNSNPGGLTFNPDTILSTSSNEVAWCHFNSFSLYPLVFQQQHLDSLLPKYPDPLLHRCFGVVMKGKQLTNVNSLTLKSSAASKLQQLNIYALTEQKTSPQAWLKDIRSEIASTEKVTENNAWKEHVQWWKDFWNRSWINITGTPNAEKVAEGYAMQRYMTACAGRGAQPIKFNGSLFTVGHDLPVDSISTEAVHNADYRKWGACFWNQNERQIYWPLIASGDYDMLMPWFKMYLKALPLAEDRTRSYFHHGGAAIIETIYFWGLPNVTDFGWNNPSVELESPYMRYHIQGGLEVVAQMLDYYDNTQDKNFLQKYILPFANAYITYYDQHYKRDSNGKLIMTPAQSIETYQVDAVNPTPDIAGLISILAKLQALPVSSTDKQEREFWRKVQAELPEIPLGKTANGKLPPNGKGDADGRATILPAKNYGGEKNVENPELYTVFPYRLFGVGKPELELARSTFHARLNPFGKCWGQDGMEAAILGLTDTAKASAIEAFTSYGTQKFPWFWSKNNDWTPDMDNGGGASTTLQMMLMQTDGKRIQLIPAWPKDWTADFKLHAPYQTTVEAHVEDGKITRLKVTPEARAKDIVIVSQK